MSGWRVLLLRRRCEYLQSERVRALHFDGRGETARAAHRVLHVLMSRSAHSSLLPQLMVWSRIVADECCAHLQDGVKEGS
eukprot:94112-Amphidinium_carterae.1